MVGLIENRGYGISETSYTPYILYSFLSCVLHSYHHHLFYHAYTLQKEDGLSRHSVLLS